MDKIRIMVVDDMQDIREYFSLVLSHEPKFEIVGQASSGKEAIAKAMEIAKEGDIIILAGKGHETYQEINHIKHDFDERVVVREILAATKG